MGIKKIRFFSHVQQVVYYNIIQIIFTRSNRNLFALVVYKKANSNALSENVTRRLIR